MRRGRPPVPPERVLAAADALFAATDAPGTISMDAIAAEAGVGKGTLFRAFGSREGLLEALWAAKLAALHEAVDHGEPPLGPGGPARERAVAFLDALLTFKLDNRHLMRARESTAGGLLRSAHYQWMHNLLSGLIDDAAPAETAPDAGYAAHALLAALHIDLIEELLATGRTLDTIRAAQTAHVNAVLTNPERD